MEVGDWITLSAVLVALGLGVASILHTNNLQRKERKERLLNEIIEWAKKSSESAIYRQKTDNNELWKAKLNYKNCRATSEYIKVISTSSFTSLKAYIDKVVIQLDEAVEATTTLIESKLSENYDLIKVKEEGLIKSVEELFEEAAKIKTRDIK